MRILLCLFVILIESGVFAQDKAESKQFANAFFSGPLTFNNTKRISNGRYCNIARKINLSNSPTVIVEGGLAGESNFLAYGEVNEIRGVGFFNEGDAGVDYVSAPSNADLVPSGRQKVVCGISQNFISFDKINESSAEAQYREYVGCRERGKGRRLGNFYLCYERNYSGIFNRTAK